MSLLDSALGRTHDKPKKNVTNWRSDSRPGLRLNWINLFAGILLVAVGTQLPKLYEAIKPLFNKGGLIGLLLLVALIALEVICLHFWKDREGWLRVGAFLAGLFLVAVVVYYVVPMLHHKAPTDWSSLLIGSLALVVVVGLLAAVSLTTWWPTKREIIPRPNK